MKTTTLLAAAIAVLAAACSATTTPPPGGNGDTQASTEPAASSDTTATAALSGTPGGTKPMCGGFAGIACPKGQICKDDPTDDCDPAKGGRDCGGICVPGADPGSGSGGECDKPERKYVARDKDKCAAIRYFCEKGYVAFHDDDCGCGCEPAEGSPPAQGQPCKDKVCGPDQFCCNPSCGICAPKGGACTQQVCN